MPVTVNGQTYYRTAEACRISGISRNTLFRWLRDGFFTEPECRDWRGWRLFTEGQIQELKAKTSQIPGGPHVPGAGLNRAALLTAEAQ